MDYAGMVTTGVQLAWEIKELAERVYANRWQSLYLSQRVGAVNNAVASYKEFDSLSAQEQAKQREVMQQFIDVLVSCRKHLRKFSKNSNWLREAWNANDAEKKFDRLNRRLTGVVGDLNLAISSGTLLRQVQQELTDEARADEDRDARLKDAQAFREMLDALMEAANETNNHISTLQDNNKKRHRRLVKTFKRTAQSFKDKEYGIDKHIIIRKNNLHISKENEKEEKLLNYGTWSTDCKIYRGKWFGHLVAIRKITQCEPKSKKMRLFNRETEILRRMNTPFVVRLHGAFYDPDEKEAVQVLEYLEDYKPLDELITENYSELSDKKHNVAYQVAQTLSLLHERGIEYTDLTLNGVLVNGKGNVKIIGISYAKSDNASLASTSASSLDCICKPKETLVNEQKRSHADVYSFGVLLWSLFEGGGIPLREQCQGRGITQKHQMKTKLITMLEQEQAGTASAKELYSQEIPSEYLELIRKCRHIDPIARPQLNDVVEELERIEIQLQISEQQLKETITSDKKAAFQRVLSQTSDNEKPASDAPGEANVRASSGDVTYEA